MESSGLYIKKISLLFILVILFCYSCSDEINNKLEYSPTLDGNKIHFIMEFEKPSLTKVSTDTQFKSNWDVGDEIGITVVKHSADGEGTLLSSGNYADNIRLTYNEEGIWKLDDRVELLYPNDGSLLDFHAYYPYKEDLKLVNTLSFDICTDQNSEDGQTDILFAKMKNIAKSKDNVNLKFSHVLSLIQVKIPSPGKGFGPGPETDVLLSNQYTDAKLHLHSGKIMNSSLNKSTIRMKRIEQKGSADYYSSYIYQAIICPQTLKEGQEIIFKLNDDVSSYKTPSNTDLLSGTVKIYEIKVPPDLHTVYIPTGIFLRGSPEYEYGRQWDETQHQVTLTKGFRMTKYEITNAQYALFLNSLSSDEIEYKQHMGNPSIGYSLYLRSAPNEPLIVDSKTINTNQRGVWRSEDGKWQSIEGLENYPVVYVTWYGAKAYAKWIGGCLPTEAQWEYACRAGSTTPWATLNGKSDDLIEYAWYRNNNKGNAQIVGQFKANEWGLYDMHGNVQEWCSDYMDRNIYTSDPVIDPIGPESPTNLDPNDPFREMYIKRGGYYNSEDVYVRSAYRAGHYSTSAYDDSGFRVIFPE